MFRKHLLTLGLVVGIFFFAQNTFGQYVLGTIYGHVSTSTGGNASNLLITFSAGPCGSFTGTSARTNSFGNYTATVPFDCQYLLIPSSKGYTFTPSYAFISFEQYDPINFVVTEE